MVGGVGLHAGEAFESFVVQDLVSSFSVENSLSMWDVRLQHPHRASKYPGFEVSNGQAGGNLCRYYY